MDLSKNSFRLIIFLTYFLIGNVYSLDIKEEENNLKKLCKDLNERSCYKMAQVASDGHPKIMTSLHHYISQGCR